LGINAVNEKERRIIFGALFISVLSNYVVPFVKARCIAPLLCIFINKSHFNKLKDKELTGMKGIKGIFLVFGLSLLFISSLLIFFFCISTN